MKYDTKSRKRLLEWLEEQNLSAYKFCRLIGGTHPNVWLWVKGNSRPSYNYALTIQKFTSGEVTVQGWSELCETAKEPKNTKHQPNTSQDHDCAFKGKRAGKPGKKVA